MRSTRRAGDPLSAEMLEQLKRLRDMPDEEIDFSDIPPTTPEFWRRARQRKALERVSIASSPLIASRQLILVNGSERETIRVDIGPLRDHVSYTGCHVHIEGVDGELHQDVFGVDGIQALQLALKFAGSELERIGNSWEFLDEQGHGFDTLKAS